MAWTMKHTLLSAGAAALCGAALLAALPAFAQSDAEIVAEAALSGDEAAFEAARELDTIEAYEAYLAAFPEGAHREEALQRIEQLSMTPAASEAMALPMPAPAAPPPAMPGGVRGLPADVGALPLPLPGDAAEGLSLGCDEQAAASGKFSCVTLQYGTNRNQNLIRAEIPKNGVIMLEQDVRYGISPDPICVPRQAEEGGNAICHLGEVTVTVPARHKTADKIKAELGMRWEVSDKRRGEAFTIWSAAPLDEETFWSRATALLADDDPNNKQAFVYIHGFNNTFEDAAFRTAQIKYDTGFDGPAFFYSWPANGKLTDYLSDQEDADLSVQAVTDFIREIRLQMPEDVEVNLIAHSMGSRIMGQAMFRLAQDQAVIDAGGFGHIIFASGDLDRCLFAEWVGASRTIAEDVTLYMSEKDKAVQLSDMLRKLSVLGREDDPKGRIGFIDELTGVPVFDFDGDRSTHQNVFTVDISDTDRQGFFGLEIDWLDTRVQHSAYAETVDIIEDIKELWAGGPADPGKRNPDKLKPVVCETGTYWRFMPDGDAPGPCPPAQALACTTTLASTQP